MWIPLKLQGLSLFLHLQFSIPSHILNNKVIELSLEQLFSDFILFLLFLADRNYLGCYKDEGNPRAFVGHVENLVSDLTPQRCTQLCYKKGFLYSATQGR